VKWDNRPLALRKGPQEKAMNALEFNSWRDSNKQLRAGSQELEAAFNKGSGKF
jgi:hypothetical protein